MKTTSKTLSCHPYWDFHNQQACQRSVRLLPVMAVLGYTKPKPLPTGSITFRQHVHSTVHSMVSMCTAPGHLLIGQSCYGVSSSRTTMRFIYHSKRCPTVIFCQAFRRPSVLFVNIILGVTGTPMSQLVYVHTPHRQNTHILYEKPP